MACPTETTFAKLQAGLLDSIEKAALHRHLDECSSCLELAGILGSIDPNRMDTGAFGSTDTVPRRYALSLHAVRPAHGMLAGLAVMAVSNLHLTVTAASIALRVVAGIPEVPSASVGLAANLRLAASIYFVAMGFGGSIVCLAAIGGLYADRRWAKRLIRRYALISMFTVVLAPLGLWLLIALGHARTPNLGR